MKTKITLKLLSAALCWGLCSCAPEMTVDGDGPQPPVPVGFAAHSTDAATRGEVIEDVSGLASKGGFEAWAYIHEGAWTGSANADLLVGNASSTQGGDIDHAHVASPDGRGGSWSYGPVPAFWPEGRMVSSFALAPADAAGVRVLHPSAETTPVVAFTLPQPGGDRVDLMFAEAVIDLTQGASGGRITERFSHALSQVGFHAFKEPYLADSEVFVTSVRLIDIYESGTAPLTTPVVWSATGQPQTLEFTTANGRLVDEAVAATSVDQADALLQSAVGALFVLPQPLSGNQLEIVYTIDGEEFVKTVPIPLSAGEREWAPARSYSILLGIQKLAELVVEVTFHESDDSYSIPETGYYYMEAWGADGGNGGRATATKGRGGEGSFHSGLYYFEAGQTIRIQVGERGKNGVTAIGQYDITGGAGGRAVVAGGTAATWFGAGGNGGQGGNYVGSRGFTGGGGGGGGAASGVLSSTGVHLAASGGGGGGGGYDLRYPDRYPNYVEQPGGGNGNGGGNGTPPGDGTVTNAQALPQGGGVSTPAQPDGGGIPGGDTNRSTWCGGGGGGGGGGYNRNGDGGGRGGQGSHGYGSGAGGTGGTNWAGGEHHKADGSTDVPGNVWITIAGMEPLSRTPNGNGVVRITRIMP